jgi:hypothetical protein
VGDWEYIALDESSQKTSISSPPTPARFVLL